MTTLIDPALLFSPEIKAAFPPTARKNILRPIIDYINMLSNNASNQSYMDRSYEKTFNDGMAAMQSQLNSALERLSAIEAIKPLAPANAIADMPATAPVSISLTNLANIGLLANNENEDRKAINKIFALLRTHGWIKP